MAAKRKSSTKPPAPETKAGGARSAGASSKPAAPEPARRRGPMPAWRRKENRPIVILSLVLIVIMGMRLALGFRPAPASTRAAPASTASATSPDGAASNGATLDVTPGSAAAQTDPNGAAAAALRAYFSLLHDGRFADAADYYGGDYAELAAANPDLAPDDHAALFAAACQSEGYQCLAVKSAVASPGASPDQVTFTVEFARDDGSLLVLETRDDAGIHDAFSFPFTVALHADRWQVEGLPIRLP